MEQKKDIKPELESGQTKISMHKMGVVISIRNTGQVFISESGNLLSGKAERAKIQPTNRKNFIRFAP